VSWKSTFSPTSRRSREEKPTPMALKRDLWWENSKRKSTTRKKQKKEKLD
jgi:hypothetical protein